MFRVFSSDPFHYVLFLPLKAEIKAQLSVNAHNVIMGIWICNVNAANIYYVKVK